jgi:hypothetical protein
VRVIKMPRDSKDLTLVVWVHSRPLSVWRFLPRLCICFRKANGDGWKSVDYDRALSVCKRIIERSRSDYGNDVTVRGTLVDYLLSEENRVCSLMRGEKVTLFG